MNFDLQLFAHKKGVSSTRNGRDSHSKRLGVKAPARSSSVNAGRTSTRDITSASARTTRCLRRSRARLRSSAKENSIGK